MKEYDCKPPSQWTAEDVEARRADWKRACETFDSYPQVGSMPDGAPIRMLGSWGEGVREASGYVCSPIAYSCRQAVAKRMAA